MNKKIMKKILSFILIATMLTISITPSFAAVTHYVVEKDGVKYQYAQEDLISSYYGDKKLYNDYISGDLKALLDDKNGYIEAEDVFEYIAATDEVHVNDYTESKEAKVIEVGDVVNLDADGNPIVDETELNYIASDFTYGYMNYKPVMQSERQIFVITGFSEQGKEKSQTNGDLVIPKMVEIEENGECVTKSVEGIDREAFKGTTLESVVFPKTIGEYDFVINTSAFANAGLEEVTFNEGIKAIKEGAFTNNNLTEVYFPSTTLTIGNDSFAHNNISDLVFSDDVEAIQIDNYAFYDNELKEVHLPYSIFKFLGYVFKGNPGTEPLSESELDANDPEGTGVVQLYTRNPKHLTSDTYIAPSKYHNVVNVAEGIDRTRLYSTIQDAKSIVLSDYPQEDVDIFLAKLSAAKDVFKDEKATQSDIDNSNSSLIDAINTLRESGIDKSNLRILIEEAKGHSSEVYTQETYAVLVSAIEKAEALLLDSTATDKEVEIAEKEIRDAIDSLVVKSDIVFTKNDFTYEGNAITGFSSTGEEKAKYNKNLVLPDKSLDGVSIEVIGQSAFQNVDPNWGSDIATPIGGIETIKLPSQLKRIEDSAFKYNSLKEVEFPETLEYIGSSAFNVNLLESVHLPDSVVELGQGVFSLNRITELSLSSKLTEIENGAFSRNLDLENVEFHEGLTRIGQSAFIGCPIKSIEFPSTLKTIERMAFSSTRLESVHIPSNVEVIEEQAFKQNVKYRTLKKVTFEEGLKSIGKGAFMDGMISEVTLPYSLEELGETAFKGNINADKESIIVKLHTTNEEHLNFETSKSKEHQKIILAAAPSTYALTFNVKDEAGMVVEDATIQVKDLEGRVVEDLAAVESGEYTYTVSKEGYVNATGTIVVSGEDVSTDITLIAEVVSEFEFDSSTGTLTAYNGTDADVVIPSEIEGIPVKAIGKQAFAKKGIESVQIPEGVETIGTGSFIQNNLTRVTLPSTVKTIEALAFANNESLVEINLNEGLETIEKQVFQNTPLEGATVVIPSTVMNIGDSAFYSQSIDYMFIKGDENSASIKFGNPIGGNGLTVKFESPKKNAEFLWNSFQSGDYDNHVDLGTIELSANTIDELKAALENEVNVKIVGIYKAKDSGVEDIRVAKSIPWDLSQVDMEQDTIILNQKTCLENEQFPEKEGYIAPTPGECTANNYYSVTIKLDKKVVSDFVIDEKGVITAYNGTDTELVIPDEVDGVAVVEIGDKAFEKKGLTSVEIPDTVTTIGEYAFRSNILTSINLPQNLEIIKKRAFYGNKLDSLTVPSSVNTIGNTAFAGNKIAELSLPKGLKTIEDGAFQANALTELTIPGSVEEITSLSFAANKNLSNVVLEEGIKEISMNAFTNDIALTGEITLPSTLEHIYASAFKGTGITSFYIKGCEDSSLLQIHSAVSGDLLENISFESPHKEAYIAFNASGNGSTDLVVDLGTIDYTGEVGDLQTYLQENLPVKESAYHVSKQDNTGKSDIVILADIDWDLEGVDFSTGTAVIYGTAKDFTAEDLASKGEYFTQPNPSGSDSENSYKITIAVDEEETELKDFTYEGENELIDEIPGEVKDADEKVIDPVITNESEEVVEGFDIDTAVAGEYKFTYSLDGYNDLIITVTVSGEESYVASDFTYEGSTITGFSDIGLSKFETNKNVIFPDESTDGTTITAIGPNAFIRDDYETGADEYISPNGIKTLVLPANLVEIGQGAFRYNAIEEVVFPETLEKIGDFAFFGNRITEVNLPDSVTEIGISSFGTNKIEKVDTSENMKSIPNGAFSRNLMLSEVILHEGLEIIEQSAFHTSNLTELTIPSTVTFIGRDAFFGHDLSSVEIPASVETVDRGAFRQRGTATLESVILNEGLREIGREAFADANISEVKLPYSLEILEYRAFKGNPGVVTLYSDNPAHLSFNDQKDASTTQWVVLTETELKDFTYEGENELTDEVITLHP